MVDLHGEPGGLSRSSHALHKPSSFTFITILPNISSKITCRFSLVILNSTNLDLILSFIWRSHSQCMLEVSTLLMLSCKFFSVCPKDQNIFKVFICFDHWFWFIMWIVRSVCMNQRWPHKQGMNTFFCTKH